MITKHLHPESPAPELERSPRDLALDASLSRKERRRRLRRWKHAARQEDVATDEGMPGGAPTRLKEINDALDALGDREDVKQGRHSPPMKDRRTLAPFTPLFWSAFSIFALSALAGYLVMRSEWDPVLQVTVLVLVAFPGLIAAGVVALMLTGGRRP